MGSHKIKITLTPQELQDLYQHMGVREMAEHFHVCRQTIRKALMRAGITLRDDRHISGQKAAWARKMTHMGKKYDYTEKPCTACEKTKILAEFTRDKNAADGRRSMCKECVNAIRNEDKKKNPEKYKERWRRSRQAIKNDPVRNARRTEYSRAYAKTYSRQNYTKKTYNLSSEEYQAMIDAQKGLCAMCGKPEKSIDPRTNKPRKLSVDHDHKTGKVRDLLCIRCNASLAYFENEEHAAAAHAYLEKHRPVKQEVANG